MPTTPPPSSAAAIFILLLSPAAVSAVAAQISGGGDNPNKYQPTTITPSMAIIIVVLIFAVFFMGIFSIYVRHCSDDAAHSADIRAAVGAAVSARSRRSPRGLPAEVLLSFPTFPYNEVKSLRLGKTVLECAVCLYEFRDDEKLRLLPKCNHLFHSECIDAWLSAHSTCPVCRALLLPDDHLVAAADGGGNEDTPSVVHLPREEEGVGSAGDAPARVRMPRSHSTGHSLGRPPETGDRFTLRLPEGVRAQLVNRGLNQVSFPTEASSRKGFHGAEGCSGFGSSSRRRYQRLGRPERGTKSDRWLFMAAPPFFSRVPAGEDGGEGSLSESGRKTAVRTAACLVASGGGGDGDPGGAGRPGLVVRPAV